MPALHGWQVDGAVGYDGRPARAEKAGFGDACDGDGVRLVATKDE